MTKYYLTDLYGNDVQIPKAVFYTILFFGYFTIPLIFLAFGSVVVRILLDTF